MHENSLFQLWDIPPKLHQIINWKLWTIERGDYDDFPGKKAGSHDYEFLRRSLNVLLYKKNKQEEALLLKEGTCICIPKQNTD
jgi:hypothetical protein